MTPQPDVEASNDQPLSDQPAASLATGDVHLWHIDLDIGSQPLECLHQLLSADEQERASRYIFDRDRRRFVAARGLLRTLLATYMQTSATEIVFQYGEYGKPSLVGTTDLTFNLSHAQTRALLAVSRGRQVGVDIEWVRPGIDILGIARSTFSPAELRCLGALPIDQQLAGFYNCWTRKEAYIKARGDGLSYPLDAFDVSLAPGSSPAMLRSAEGPGELRRWVFVPVDAPTGYAAALAVEAPVNRIRIAMLPRHDCHSIPA